MRIALQPAYVLHSRPYRDSSLLLEVFTAEQGRLGLVARGARRRTRGGSSAALLQAFRPLLLSFAGRGELQTLTACESAGSAAALHKKALLSALYVNELLVHLLHRHDPHPRLFAAYAEVLANLAASDAAEPALRRFELTLLNELGYGFAADVDGLTGEAVVAEGSYRYEPEHGMVRLQVADSVPDTVYSGTELLALAQGDFAGVARLASKRLLRDALAVQLGGRALRSRDLFRPVADIVAPAGRDVLEDDR